VLLVDDDRVVASVFRRLLQQRGFEVLVAGDGGEALTVAKERSPEVVLMDLQMPRMGGLEALGEFSRQFPDMPVIIVSGTGDINTVIEALRLGASDYLIKPVGDGSTLIHRVETNLERARLKLQKRHLQRQLELHLERMREDEEAGRRIQARLCPPADWQFAPYRFDYRVIPSLVLSGDMPDYFRVDDQYAVFYCADVAGHGVPSALVTVLVKGLIAKYFEHYRNLLDPLVLEPDQLLLQLNKELLEARLDKHLTLFYGVLDRHANRLRYSSGGHYPPPLLFTPDGIQTLDQESMAVGLFPFARFETQTLVLPAAFRLLLFSDGALDAMTLPSAEAKLARLRQLGTPDALNRFVNEVSANQELPDDFAFLSVTREDAP
jgi:serine phosphatase RsbU (regulator of sigma subunit)